MKKWGVLLLGLTVCTALIGLIGKSSFKDRGILSVSSIEDIKSINPNINQIFTEADVELFIADYEEGRYENLSDDTEVWIVQSNDKITQYDFSMLQEVKILQVLKGTAEENSIAEVVSSGGIYDQKYRYHSYDNEAPVFFGMMNVMLPKQEYLLFVKKMDVSKYTDKQYYRTAFPLFSYFNLTEDYAVALNASADTLRYNDVGNSEFLCDTQETVRKLMDFKQKVIGKFVGKQSAYNNLVVGNEYAAYVDETGKLFRITRKRLSGLQRTQVD